MRFLALSLLLLPVLLAPSAAACTTERVVIVGVGTVFEVEVLLASNCTGAGAPMRADAGAGWAGPLACVFVPGVGLECYPASPTTATLTPGGLPDVAFLVCFGGGACFLVPVTALVTGPCLAGTNFIAVLPDGTTVSASCSPA